MPPNGHWTMLIKGAGPHSGQDAQRDADVLLQDFKSLLENTGHSVTQADFSVDEGPGTGKMLSP